MSRALLTSLSVFFLIAAVEPARATGCPGESEVLATVRSVDPALGSRTSRFHAEPPMELYRRAAGKVGKALADRDGKTVRGVMLVERPIELMWKALNDEPHHALDGKYFPVRHSEVIDGVPRGQERTVFQYFKKAGIGRWWVSRVTMNTALYEESAGKIWELYWEAVIDGVDTDREPIRSVAEDVAPLRESFGAWFLVPMNGSCTLVEYYNYTEPGGFVSFAQSLMAKSAVRDTLEAIVRLGDEHLSGPDPDGERFIRPDGSPLD